MSKHPEENNPAEFVETLRRASGEPSKPEQEERRCQFIHKSGIVCMKDIASPIHAIGGHHFFAELPSCAACNDLDLNPAVVHAPTPAQSVVPCPDCGQDHGWRPLVNGKACPPAAAEQPARDDEPTTERALWMIRKMEKCTSDAAKLILLRGFCDLYAASQLAKQPDHAHHVNCSAFRTKPVYSPGCCCEVNMRGTSKRAEAAESLVEQLREQAVEACIDMAERYDADIEGCDGDELVRFGEGITCSFRLAYIIKYGKFPPEGDAWSVEFTEMLQVIRKRLSASTGGVK